MVFERMFESLYLLRGISCSVCGFRSNCNGYIDKSNGGCSFHLYFCLLYFNLFLFFVVYYIGSESVWDFIYQQCRVYGGEYFIPEHAMVSDYQWLIKWNPFSHLVFGIHSSKIEELNQLIHQKGIAFDLNESLLLFIILSVVTIIAGCILVHYHAVITANNVKGGI